jgi:hypothetical protein
VPNVTAFRFGLTGFGQHGHGFACEPVFRPPGLFGLPAFSPNGLRHGLHSYAAPRLGGRMQTRRRVLSPLVRLSKNSIIL